MTLTAQLRALADRLEELDRQRFAVTEELLLLVGDRFAILDGWDLPAAPTHAGAVRVKRTPAHQAGDAGSTPAPRSTPSARSLLPARDHGALRAATKVACPDCGEPFSPRGLGVHRRHVHAYTGQVKVPAACPDCGKVIAQGQNLKRHRQLVHGGQKLASSNGAPVIRKGGESWVCARCPESFPSRAARDEHQGTHPPAPPGPSVGRADARHEVDRVLHPGLRGGA